jgi:hypothetical protein
MKRILIFQFFLLGFLLHSQAQNYGIKGRWNTKLSLSFNRTNEHNDPFMEWETIPSHPIQMRHNLRAECNYGILNWLEIGGYIGYMRYHNIYDKHKCFDRGKDYSISFAPTFGVNANVHLLPFGVKNKNCRWELYLTAKYGGTYLINHYEFTVRRTTFSSNKSGKDEYFIHCFPNRYRDIFGAGIGGGVYFKNLVGVYAEIMCGQYSYFQEVWQSYTTARVGIAFKFTSKKKKEKVIIEEEEEEN